MKRKCVVKNQQKPTAAMTTPAPTAATTMMKPIVATITRKFNIKNLARDGFSRAYRFIGNTGQKPLPLEKKIQPDRETIDKVCLNSSRRLLHKRLHKTVMDKTSQVF